VTSRASPTRTLTHPHPDPPIPHQPDRGKESKLLARERAQKSIKVCARRGRLVAGGPGCIRGEIQKGGTHPNRGRLHTAGMPPIKPMGNIQL
jgi:hypothetical protein